VAPFSPYGTAPGFNSRTSYGTLCEVAFDNFLLKNFMMMMMTKPQKLAHHQYSVAWVTNTLI